LSGSSGGAVTFGQSRSPCLRYEESIGREQFTEEQRRITSDIADADAEIAKLALANDDYDQLCA
jgi:hypothetical protein